MDFSKPRWATEAAQRILEAEGLTDEAALVRDRYTADAAYLESTANALGAGRVMLPNFPAFNQLLDPTWDGSSQNRLLNCGPSSIAMCVSHLTDVRLWDDDIIDSLSGPGFRGYTTTDQLSQFLRERCDIPNEVTYNADPSARLRRALNQGHPTICLFYFDIRVPSSGHFTPIYGYTPEGFWRSNPWGGSYEFLDNATFNRWYKGYVIECFRSRYYGNI